MMKFPSLIFAATILVALSGRSSALLPACIRKPIATCIGKSDLDRRAAMRTTQNVPYLPSSLSLCGGAAHRRTALAASTSDDRPSGASKKVVTATASTISIIALDVAFRRLLKRLSISFPSSLAGCGALFAALVALYSVKADWGDGLYDMLSPGAGVLAKWLPVFFVPSLITLPLAPSLGSAWEFAKVSSVIVGGFLFTLFTTAWSVLGVRTLQEDGSITEGAGSSGELSAGNSAPDSVTQTPAPKAFADSTFNGLVLLASASSVAAALASKTSSSLSNPLQASFMLFTTLSTFVFGARLPKSFAKVVHPLVTCTTLSWAAAVAMGVVTGQTFHSMLMSYKVGTLSPALAGAGDILLFLLGPAVVALACQMYSRKKLMAENIAEVGTAVIVSSLGGLFGTAAAVRLLNIGNPMLRLCLLSRNITSPLAMAIAAIVGADVSLAVTMVVVTGLIGANFGANILDAFGIKDAVARGLGIGAAAHGLGTAAFSNEKDAFPFAAISMALTASACTVLVSIPLIKKALLKIALG